MAEEVDEFDCGCGRASSEPPDVGVEDVDAVDDCHYARRKAIAGCAVGMEVHGNFYRGFEFAYDGGGAQRVDKACHILQGDDLCAEGFHFLGFVDEVFVGEDLFRFGFFFAEESAEKAFGCGCFGLGIDCIAYGSVGDSAQRVYKAYRFLYVVDVVQCVEDTHNVKTVGDSFLIESFEDIVGVGYITEKVAAAR